MLEDEKYLMKMENYNFLQEIWKSLDFLCFMR